jgi:hypothetical protein
MAKGKEIMRNSLPKGLIPRKAAVKGEICLFFQLYQTYVR